MLKMKKAREDKEKELLEAEPPQILKEPTPAVVAS
jgi:hypothetical protein